MADKKMKLQVNDLKISFRTNNGRVQAVRNISFDLYEGETLAIVGESGSGKSVTSRAIMGILAPNSIVESGEILYDGKDLMQITEEDFHSLRGDKISMVFQDPLSSLNPIVKIGKQLTEAMILKNKLTRKENGVKLKSAFKILQDNMCEVLGAKENKEVEKKVKSDINEFKTFVNKYIELQNAYNDSIEMLGYAKKDLTTASLLLEKNVSEKLLKTLISANKYVLRSVNKYTLEHKTIEEHNLLPIIASVQANEIDYQNSLDVVKKLLGEVENAINKVSPNFFSLAYYLTKNNNAEAEFATVEEMNAYNRKYLDDNFMLEFIDNLEKGVRNVFDTKNNAKIEAISKLTEAFDYVNSHDELDQKESKGMFNTLYATVESCDNPLRIGKDTFTTTFGPTIRKNLELYFNADKINDENEKKYNREKAKFDKIVAKGKTPSYTVAQPNYLDEETIKSNIARIIKKLISSYKAEVAAYENFDSHEYTISIIDYLKELSGNTVFKVSKRSAKERALILMEEVGIPEPEKRYNQYPFQFSGGMRQRIVIAIALSANPDVLICDEPTTALDVTIQAQILELINKLKKERNLSIIFITHDLGVVANMADRIAVMYAGKIVEYGDKEEVFYDPKHPYTWALLASMPDLETKEKLSPIPGTPPNMIYPPKGDAFAARNKYALKIDFEKQPPLFKVTDTHYAATWLLHPDAPKTTPPSIVTERINRMLNAEKEEKNNE